MNGNFDPEQATNGGAPQSEPTNGDSATTTAPGLSADEIALYDRQIRLWGAQAQERIRSANILLVSLRALGTEIAKNLTLAGISSLTIIDNEAVTEEDLGTQYFLREEDVGKSVSFLPLHTPCPNHVTNLLSSVPRQPFLAFRNLTLALLSKLVALSPRFSTFKTLHTTRHLTASSPAITTS